MGLIPKTGRRDPKVRGLLFAIFLILCVGAASMLVPFMLMLSGSTRTGVDLHEFSLVPRFVFDEELLFQKYVEGLYNESPSDLRAAWGTDHRDFSDVRLLPEVDMVSVDLWASFLEINRPQPQEYFSGYVYAPVSRGRPVNVRGFMHSLLKQFDGSIESMNREMETDFKDWNAFRVLPPDTRSRNGFQTPSDFDVRWQLYVIDEAPQWSVGVYNLDAYFHERVTATLHGRDASRVRLTDSAGDGDENWELFVREVVHPGYVRMDPAYSGLWQEFLRARYGTFTSYRNVTGMHDENWSHLSLPSSLPENSALATDWLAFLEGWTDLEEGRFYQMPLDGLRLESLDLLWRAASGEEPPIRQWDQWRFKKNTSEIRKAFLIQNYATVWEILIVHGRGLWVTVVYCAGAVLIALIVNPLAAYALSRFRPKNSYAFLLYLLLTMAFPPMVTQIPLFLMLRDLHLLNTFWALLLPGMAHGYSIFLLKGFFDSLPRELYESASLDGAGELLMFRVITLSLSKPILAVIALSAFVNAYTGFMFALLICQDERMWTLMVWLYQLQQNYGSGVMNAAFVLAALPTLIVFLLAQRQILRGIVVPSEK
ncbi:carbohydrate ABC transporter permease [Kiritimatiellaeota bacterium B1221]|nr:carbohydrate ABC transporter permease [Kiritimatiellaeota bacterium B1221]